MKASSTEWATLEGRLHLDTHPRKVVFYLEGPPSGVDLLVSTVIIKHANPPECEGSPLKRKVKTPDKLTYKFLEGVLTNLRTSS